MEVGGAKLREVATSTADGLQIARLPSLRLGVLKVNLDSRVLGKVALDELRALVRSQVRLLGYAEGAEAVDDSEVHHLGDAPHLRGHGLDWHVVHLRGSGGVDILVPQEGLQQPRIPGEVRQDAKLYLGVVDGQEGPLRRSLRHEGSAHLPTQLRAYGYVLQVGIVAGHAASRRPRLVVAGVDAPRERVDQLRQGVHVRRLQLGELTILQNAVQHLKRPGVCDLYPALVDHHLEVLQHGRVGGVARLGALGSGQPQLVEQHIRQLLGGVEREPVPDCVEHLLLQAAETLAQVFGHLPQLIDVQIDAVALHPDQHRNQGYLHAREHLRQGFLALQRRLEDVLQALGHIGVGGSVVGRLLNRNLGHSLLFAPSPNQSVYRRHFLVEASEGQVL